MPTAMNLQYIYLPHADLTWHFKLGKVLPVFFFVVNTEIIINDYVAERL